MEINIKDGIAYITPAKDDDWGAVVAEGHRLCSQGQAENVVLEDGRRLPDLTPYTDLGQVDEADIVIIGGGVIGCGIARELSKYDKSVLLLEKNEDLCEGTSKANNGMIHSGYDSKPGTLKAKLNVAGNRLYTEWAEALHFKFNRTGSFVCGFTEEDEKALRENYENGLKNQVPGIALLTGDEARQIEPALSEAVATALWTPTAGYVEPYEVTLKLMENAMDNGGKLRLNCEVAGFLFSPAGEKITHVVTPQGLIKCGHVINAAGLYADDIAWYARDRFYSLHPRRGVLAIFDRQSPCKPKTFAGLAPGKYSKGGGPMMSPEGNMIWGPSAEEIQDKDNLAVDNEGLQFVLEKGMALFKGAEPAFLITYFAGNRAAAFTEDFIICNSKKIHNFTHVAGIQSPGLASAPAIAHMVVQLVNDRLPLEENKSFNPYLPAERPFRELPQKDRRKETLVCRCEMVTEDEIIRAIHGKIPATTVDAVKRRTRAGMGRCQGGFCGARVLEILARELSLDPTEITLKGKGSEILMSDTRRVAK